MDRPFLAAASLITPPVDVCKGNRLLTFPPLTNNRIDFFPLSHFVISVTQNVILLLAKVQISCSFKGNPAKIPSVLGLNRFCLCHIT